MAGTSIFNDNTYKFQNGVKDSCISFSLVSNGKNIFEGLVAQQLQFGVTRQPTLIYEIGTTNYYTVAGRPAGSGSMSNVFGPTSAALNAIKDLGDICNPSEFKITLKNCSCKGNGGGGGNQTLTFTGGFLSGITIQADSQNPTAQGSWSFVFQDMLIG